MITPEITEKLITVAETLNSIVSYYKKLAEEESNKSNDCYQVLSVKHYSGNVHNVWNNESTWWRDVRAYELYSIKRLSDGQTFTIGDSLLTNDGNVACISKIIPAYQTIFFSLPNRTTISLSDAKKVVEVCEKSNSDPDVNKQPLFITHNNEPIYKGDTYYIVVIEDVYNAPYSIVKINNAEDPPYGHNINFKTKEQAEQWLVLNKPCLSVNDIVVLWSLGNAATDTLTKLAKSKING